MFYPSILNKLTLFVFKCQLTPIILLNATTLAWIGWINQKDKEAYFTGYILKISPERKNILHECHSNSTSASWVICRMELKPVGQKARLCLYQYFTDHYLALSNVHNSFINIDVVIDGNDVFVQSWYLAATMKLPILWTMIAANRVSCIVSQMLHTVRQNQHDVQFSFLICQPSTLCLAKSLSFYKSNAEIVGHLVLVGATAKM